MKAFRKKKNTPCNRIVIITGCAGSGKTTVGKELAKKIGYAYVDKDTVTRNYTDFILKKLGSNEGDRESELYVKQLLPIEYYLTFKVCREILENGCNVVVTLPFIQQIRNYEEWENLKEKINFEKNADFKFVWILHNIDTEKSNIKKRGARRDDNKLKNWDKYAESVDGIEPDARYNAFLYTNDCTISLEHALEELIKWIEN